MYLYKYIPCRSKPTESPTRAGHYRFCSVQICDYGSAVIKMKGPDYVLNMVDTDVSNGIHIKYKISLFWPF